MKIKECDKQMNKKGNAMAYTFVGLIIAIIFFSVVATLSNNATQVQSKTDTFTKAQPVPFNVSLTESDAVSLTTITNGTTALDSSNYTSYVTQELIQINDNSSWLGATGEITYTYRDASYISGGTTRLIATFLPILVLVIIILYLVGVSKQ